MKVDAKKLKIFLSDLGLVPKKDLEDAFRESVEKGTRFEDVLMKRKYIPAEEMDKLRAYVLGIPFVDLTDLEIDPEVLEIISEPVSRQYNAIAFDKKGSQLRIAMLDPDDLQFIDFVNKKTGFNVIPCMTNKKGIAKGLKLFQKSLQDEFGEMVGGPEMKALDDNGERIIVKKDNNEKDDIDPEKAAEDLPVIKIVDTLLKHAIIEGASDIHIEPEEKDVVIRYR